MFVRQAHPDEVQLLVAVVNYKTKLVKPRRGLCSTWLASLDCSNKDLRVPVWIKKGTISFPKAVGAPTVMIGPGAFKITASIWNSDVKVTGELIIPFRVKNVVLVPLRAA